MRYAVLSDIHGNLEALQEALAFVDGRRVDMCLFAGDIVGYGANPNECLELVHARSGKIVMGNHEKALFDSALADCFSDHAHEALNWTAGTLADKWRPLLADLSYVYIAGNFSLAHGSFHEPEAFHYLFTFEDAVPSFSCLTTAIGWIGHTHVPAIFLKGKETASYLPAGVYKLERGETYLLNPGSVGQPRDRDCRLSLALFDEETYQLELVRLPYDNKTAAEKIRRAGLPGFLADRLL